MTRTLERVRALVARSEVRVSLHGYEELAADGVLVRDVIDGLNTAIVVEDYPDYPKGPRSVDAEFIEDVKTQVRDAANALRGGNLPALPATKKCGACDYRGMCTAGVAAARSKGRG